MVDFLVLGNMSGSMYNNVFPLIKSDRVIYGYSITSGSIFFEVPDDYELYGTLCKEEGGKKMIAMGIMRWFTSMRDTPPQLFLYKKYNSYDYQKFDNYDAINVDRTEDIPIDYDGVMGVPISFLDKYNYEQFKIIGFLKNGCRFDEKGLQGNNGVQMTMIDGVCKYLRLLIKRK